jgi:hypothetical protein
MRMFGVGGAPQARRIQGKVGEFSHTCSPFMMNCARCSSVVLILQIPFGANNGPQGFVESGPDGPHRKRVAAWWFTVGPTHSGIGDLTV